MASENGVPVDNCSLIPPGELADLIAEYKSLMKARIEELESENGELKTQVLDLQSSEQGHVRARQMDEEQIKKLIEENERLKECISAFLFEATPWLDVSGAMYNQDLAGCADRRLRSGLGEG